MDIARQKGRDSSIQFKVKDFQAWHTDWNLVTLNGPAGVNVSCYAEEAKEILVVLEERLVWQYPFCHSAEVHTGDFLQMHWKYFFWRA